MAPTILLVAVFTLFIQIIPPYFRLLLFSLLFFAESLNGYSHNDTPTVSYQ